MARKKKKAGSKGITKFGRTLAAFRKKTGMDRKELASKLGISPGYVAFLETGALGSDGEVMRASEKVQERFAAVSESLANLGKATAKKPRRVKAKEVAR